MTNMRNSMNEPQQTGEIINDMFKTIVDETKNKKCPYCGKELQYRILVVQGRISQFGYLEECNCEGYLQEQKRKEQEELLKMQKEAELKQIERLFIASNLGRRFRDRTFESFEREANPKAYDIALDYAQNFETYKRRGQGLVFIGEFGTGKTHLAAAIANYLIQRKVPVVFGTLAGLLREVKKTYDEDSIVSTEQIENRLKKVDLLIIDDLGKEKVTDWVLEKFYEIVNFRYENYMPFVITTNLTLKEIKQKFDNQHGYIGGAITSRLIEMCRVVKTEGEDYRKNLRKRGSEDEL